jgi:hypothetical protein
MSHIFKEKNIDFQQCLLVYFGKQQYLSRPGYEIFCYLSDLTYHINVSIGGMWLKSDKKNMEPILYTILYRNECYNVWKIGK